MITTAIVILVLAAVPATLYTLNLGFYRPPVRLERDNPPAVSVLIPARDEAATIAEAVTAALAGREVTLEVVVLNDGSTDGTAAIVAGLAANDARLRLVDAPPLPSGWCGKPHACWHLAELAQHPVLVFQDADVRLAPTALRLMADELSRSGADLISGVPRQRTGSLVEAMLIPLIHTVLLGYLPLPFMRWTRLPAFAAGCGQLFVANRDAYFRADGHRAIPATLHDGLTLPSAFRRAGLKTDLFDATEVADCRMYHGTRETWRGLTKNAIEGMAAPSRIGVFTVLLLGGHVAPLVLLVMALALPAVHGALPWALGATVLAYLPRLHAAWRFKQDWRGALLHPLGVLLLVAAQWHALVMHLRGRPATWRGRSYLAGARAAGG